MPKPAITMTEASLKVSAEMLNNWTMVERKSVKKVKLSTKPTTTPIGLPLPVCLPPIVEERMMGRIGRIQGERMVTIPARNANAIKSIIIGFRMSDLRRKKNGFFLYLIS